MVENVQNMIDKSEIKTVFVDVDDTLWWFTENSKLALRHVYDVFGLSEWQPQYDIFRDIYLEKNHELWQLYHYGKIEKDYLITERFRYTLWKIGIEDGAEDMAKRVDDEYLTFLGKQKLLVPGARELLEYLNGRYEVHVLSNGFKGVQEQKLESGGILHLIGKVIISDNCGYTKPMRGIFDYALKECGCEAKSSVMIGDNADADICGAHNAGWNTIYFNIHHTERCSVADVEVQSLDEVKSYL